MRTQFGGFGQQVVLFVPEEFHIWGEESPGDLDPETASIVVGTRFKIPPGSAFMNVLGIRWFRTDGFPGVSEVALWKEDVIQSEQTNAATVVGETTEGWQKQYFEHESVVETGEIYIAAALYIEGAFRSTPGLLVSPIVTEDGFIEVIENSEVANGVYDFSGTMICPTTSAAETCFYIDIIYTAI